MKSILTLLLLTASCSMTLAQKEQRLYVDVGINHLGVAATYDRKLTKHFDIGGGINTFYNSSLYYANSRTALYADFRPHWTWGRSTLFMFLDVGAAYNAGVRVDSNTLTAVNFYSSLGIGYHYRINKKGMGPYALAGLYLYRENLHSTRANLPERAREYGILDGYGILSLGFRF